MMTLLEKAKALARFRIFHCRKGTTTNVQLVIDIGFTDIKEDAVKLCQSLGLYPWGLIGSTKLKTMTDYMDK